MEGFYIVLHHKIIHIMIGVVGLDDENSQMNLIDFERIKGGKPFDINEDWFKTLLSDIGQQK